jgi:cytochrome c-type biogenesis protein CcmE
MNRKRKHKLLAVVSLVVILSVAIGLVLYALKQNINLFYTPEQLLSLKINPEQSLRVGGYVQKNSVHYAADGKQVTFVIMDPSNAVTVSYAGVLPSLFREGQGVVVTGRLVDANTLQASDVLAKHDEKYVPRYMVKDAKVTEK